MVEALSTVATIQRAFLPGGKGLFFVTFYNLVFESTFHISFFFFRFLFHRFFGSIRSPPVTKTDGGIPVIHKFKGHARVWTLATLILFFVFSSVSLRLYLTSFGCASCDLDYTFNSRHRRACRSCSGIARTIFYIAPGPSNDAVCSEHPFFVSPRCRFFFFFFFSSLSTSPLWVNVDQQLITPSRKNGLIIPRRRPSSRSILVIDDYFGVSSSTGSPRALSAIDRSVATLLTSSATNDYTSA